MRLEAGYKPGEYETRAKSLCEAAVVLNDSIGQIVPQADILLFGSLGRRLAMWNLLRPGDTSLGEYLEEAPEELRPRRNERGSWDIDMGVSDKDMTWRQIAAISKKVTLTNRQIEIDPHLLAMTGSNEFEVNNYGALARGSNLSFETTRIGIEGSELPWRPINIDAMLAYYFDFGKMRPKDVRDIAFVINFLTREVDYEQEIISERVRTQAVKYLRSARAIKDVVKMGYHMVTPELIQREVRRVRHRPALVDFNFNSPDPIYI